MTGHRIAFAVPGALTNLTGGTIYDRRVVEALPNLGIAVDHIELPGSFPFPPAADIDRTMALLSAVPSDTPLIVDGLAFGALPPEAVATLRAPLIPLVHHPLAEETGLDPETRARLHETEARNLTHARHILVPSPHTAALLTAKYGVAAARITVARPGTDRPSVTRPKADPPLILAVGIQLPRKGHDVLIDALAQIRDLDWQAVIAGSPLDPTFAEKLQAMRRDLGLEDRLHLPGKVAQDALQTLYARATIFALATRYEGYGIVFDEALAHGLPIISCAAGAVPDTVPRDAGVLVPPDAPEAFATALRAMLTDPDRRATYARAAQVAGRALPTWQDTANTIAAALSPHFALNP